MTTAGSQGEPGLATVDANGLRIASLGAGDGPLVLLLHGFPDTAHGWRPVLNSLAEAGYRAVAPNLRGYSPTGTAPDGDYSVIAAARDTLALVQALGHRRAAVVGVDWGALIAQVAANLDAEAVWKLGTGAIPHARIVPTLGPVGTWLARHVLLFQLPGIAERIVRRDGFAYIDGLYRRWSPTWNAGVDATAEVKRALAAPGGLSGALGYYRCLRRSYLRGDERRVICARTSVPTLAFVGAADHVLGPKTMARNEDAFTGPYELVVFPGVGHFPHREHPEAVAGMLLDFLGPASDAPR